jgi:hypothetical protein
MIEQAEESNPTLTYVPYLFNDIFPGFVDKFPKGALLKKVVTA